jgi:hypothetical protein
MKTKEEIEQLAKEEYPSIIGTTQTGVAYDMNSREKEAYIKGYTQCQEHMADKKYTEEAMLLAYVSGGTRFEENKDADKLSENFKELISLLNKQD